MKKQYIPQPADVSNVELPQDLQDLIEELAKNVHETWALWRVKDGWSWGEQRDETLKVTPCLVPYDELPEKERLYDRATVLATLKYALSLGYEIHKKETNE